MLSVFFRKCVLLNSFSFWMRNPWSNKFGRCCIIVYNTCSLGLNISQWTVSLQKEYLVLLDRDTVLQIQSPVLCHIASMRQSTVEDSGLIYFIRFYYSLFVIQLHFEISRVIFLGIVMSWMRGQRRWLGKKEKDLINWILQTIWNMKCL